MNKIIGFEYCALVIEILIIFSVYLRNITRGRLNRWYLACIYSIALSTVFDIIGMELEKAGPGNVFLKYLSNTICLWSTAATAVVLCGYLFAQTGVWYFIRNNKIAQFAFYLPIVVNTILVIIVNPFTKIIFYIDSDGMYARGSCILLLYGLALVYVCIGVCVVLKYRKVYTIRKAVSVFLLLGASVIATFIQMFFPDVIIQMFCTAVAALILLIEVQAPEERMHAGTGVFSMHAYVSDVKNLFDINSKFDVILAVITNYNVLIDMLGYFNAMSIINATAKRLLEFNKENRLNLDIYYLEGGKFAIICDEIYSDRLFEIAQAINGRLLMEHDVLSTKVSCMANICAISCPKDIDNPDFLFAFDETLGQEAFSGELRYAEKLFDKKNALFKHDFGEILDRAFSDGLLEVHYQPVYNARDERYFSVEAFLRLTDPVYGYINPELLISEAERSSAIHAITTYVVEEVCKFISQPEFLLLGLEFVEINLSPVQCMWSDLLAVVLSTVRNYNVQPKSIAFNITDVDNYERYTRMKANLQALSQVGFKLVMDDFGSGIFEIERVSELPLMEIKLDRSFIRNGLDKSNLSVLKGTIRLINDMGRGAAAIGVEDEETLKKLIEFGCIYVQGYYFCKPLEKKELIKFLLLD